VRGNCRSLICPLASFSVRAMAYMCQRPTAWSQDHTALVFPPETPGNTAMQPLLTQHIPQLRMHSEPTCPLSLPDAWQYSAAQEKPRST
jgi:hypothetical protein